MELQKSELNIIVSEAIKQNLRAVINLKGNNFIANIICFNPGQ